MSNPINGCADIEAHMAEQLPAEISVTWCVEDVLATSESLTDHQARLVLQQLEKKHDATIGINWEVIEYTIDAMRREGEL